VCGVFTQALARYGTPEELLTDNGKVFTGRLGPHPSEVLFDRICREQGITHLLTGVRCPTTAGKIECFHKTLRAELLAGRRFDSLRAEVEVTFCQPDEGYGANRVDSRAPDADHP
jgi:transposase InsO family protein